MALAMALAAAARAADVSTARCNPRAQPPAPPSLLVPNAALAASALQPDAIDASLAASPPETAGPAQAQVAARLVAAGHDPQDAAATAQRAEERLQRLSAAFDAGLDRRFAGLYHNAEIMAALLGARPAFLATTASDEDADRIVTAARVAVPHAEAVSPGNRVFVYDPALVVEAMRRATQSGRPKLSFAKELAAMQANPQPRQWLRGWLSSWLGALFNGDSSDHRVGALLGYALNDVEDLVENRGTPSVDGVICKTISMGGDPRSTIHWLTADHRHPETVRQAKRFEIVLDRAVSALGELRLAALNRAAYRFADASRSPYGLARDREDALADWRRRAEELESAAAQAGRPVEVWDRVFVADDGAVSSFFRSQGTLFAVRPQNVLDAAPQIDAKADPAPGKALSEADVLPWLAQTGAFLPMTRGANLFRLNSDPLFDPEGEVIDALRRRGVRGATVKRIKSRLHRLDDWTRREGGRAAFADDSHRRFLLGLLQAAFPNSAGNQRRLENFVVSRQRQEAARQALRQDKTLVADVLRDPRFPGWAAALRRLDLSAHGNSDAVVAEKLLLAMLERDEAGRGAPPELAKALDELAGVIGDSARYAALREAPPRAGPADRPDDLSGLLEQARRDISARSGLWQRALAAILEAFKVLPKKADPSDVLDPVERLYRQAGVENAGGFAGAARSRYTLARLFPGTGYYSDARPLPPIEQARPRYDTLTQSLRRVLTGNASYDELERKLADERPTIKAFLLSSDSPAFPGLGRLLREHINPVAILSETSRSEAPGTPSRFFPTWTSWEAMAWDRVIFDFARGVEIQLLRQLSLRRFAVRLVSNWRPEDFSRASDDDFARAVDRTLAVGRIRSQRFLSRPRALSDYRFKDLKDAAKRAVFQNLPKTKFLRNRFTWYSYFGVGWDCLCWARESLFRVTFKK